jgi:predicted permease
MIISVFLISLPIFLIIFVGWLMRKFKIVGDDWIHTLNDFAYYVALPALIISSFWGVDFLSRDSLNVIAWSAATVALMCLAVFALLHFLKIDQRLKMAIFLSATAGNAIYMGFPLVELGFGREYLSDAALIGTIYLILPLLITMLAINYWQCRENENCLRRELADFVKNPLVISAVAGVALSFIDFNHPVIAEVKQAVLLLGATASPVALFALGGFLYGKFAKNNLVWITVITGLKTFVFPFVVVFAAALRFGPEDIKIFALLSSLPVAVTAFVIAEKFNLDKNLVGNSILVSTIVSFFIAPLIIYLFG